MPLPADDDLADLAGVAGGASLEVTFAQLEAKHRRELRAHCYRMLGSAADADDALQEAFVGAWKGLASFENRSSHRTWLYRIATNACLRMLDQRASQPRLLSFDRNPPWHQTADLGVAVVDDDWLEPFLDNATNATDAAAVVLQKESIELAFVAALQHLPATQRAVLILCEVMDFSAADAAAMLETSTASVNSALQRARAKLAAIQEKTTATSQRDERHALGREREQKLVGDLVRAWQSGDGEGVRALLTEDVRFTMPPLPAWFEGRDDVMRFFVERVFATPWRLVPIEANGQLAFACYQKDAATSAFTLGAVNVVSLRGGRIAWLAGFLDPSIPRRFGIPPVLD